MPKTGHFHLKLKSRDPIVDDPTIAFVLHSETATDFATITPVCQHVEHFLTIAGTGGANPLDNYISKVINAGLNISETIVYDITAHLDGTPAGSPVAIHNWTITPGGADDLPEGVCVTVSFRADYGTDVEFGAGGSRPRARDRNRVYVGPLEANAVTEIAGGRVAVSTNFQTDALAAMFDLSSSVMDGSGNEWVLQVWSRKDAALKLPTMAWLDDRPDYQRRRVDQSPGSRTYRALASV